MPKRHPHDSVMVHNVWIDAPKNLVITRTTQKTVHMQGDVDPSGMEINQQAFRTVEHSFKPSEAFEFKWGGKIYRMRPNQKRVFPRYLAEHFAKHLANAMLGEKDPMGTKKLVSSVTERPKLIKKIILGTVSHVGGDMEEVTADDLAMQQAEQYNESVDNGDYDPLLGELVPDADDDTTATDDGDGLDDTNQDPPANDPFEKRTKEELIKEAAQLGVDIKSTDKKDDIIAKIKAF